MRIILLIVLAFFMSGCAEKEVTKSLYLKRLKETDFAALMEKHYPGIILCFGDDRFETTNALVSEFTTAIDEAAGSIPPYVNSSKAEAHGEEIGIVAMERYLKKRIGYFSIKGLTYAEQKRCERLEKNYKKDFIAARYEPIEP